MNAYGFRIKNTPFITSTNGIFFKDYYSASFAAVPSLISSFYLKKNYELKYNNIFITLTKKAE